MLRIHFAIVGDIAAHHRALQEMDVVQPVGDARGIMQILDSAVAIVLPRNIDHADRRARRAIMHAVARKRQVVARIATT